MTNFLDWLFEYLLVAGIITIMVLMFFGFFVLPKMFRKKNPFRFPFIILVFGPFLWLWLLLFSGAYGYAHNPAVLGISNDHLLFMDAFTRRSKSSSYIDYRMYVVDATTGQRKYRTLLGTYSKLLAEKNGMVLYTSDGEYSLLDPTTNSVLKIYSKTTIPTMFPAASSGISELEFGNENSGDYKTVLTAICKNGNTYFIDPFAGTISDAVVENNAKRIFKKDFYESVSLTGETDSTNKKIEFVSKKGSVGSILSMYSNGNRTNATDGKTFLFPQIISVFSKTGIMIVKSYETTDKTNFLLTGVDMNLKPIWEVNQHDLEGTNTSNNELKNCVKYKDNFIFNLDDIYYSVNAKTGSVNWKNKL